MERTGIPSTILNWISGTEVGTATGETFPKLSPVSGKALVSVARSRAADVEQAVGAARRAQKGWAERTAVERGDVLLAITQAMRRNQEQIAAVVAAETGMSVKQARGETGGAIAQGEFMAGEGRRLYGRTTTSAVPNKYAMTVRQPLGVAGLIIAANTPIANVAWKVFPALVCGNAAVLKAAEDTPATAWIFGKLAHEVGLPPGVLNIIQGYGEEAGAPLVAHPGVDVISFTGSSAVGRQIARIAGARLARVSLELGGKNPLVVCDDADLENAARWVLLSAFSNAGQRCAAGSRIIIFNSVYDRFRDMLVERTKRLRAGPGDDDDFGPVINEEQLTNMVAAVERARERGAVVLAGGHRLTDPAHAQGFFMAPTLIENVGPHDEISTSELFGPVTCLYRVEDFAEALSLANESPYGLTACIHTRSIHRAVEFAHRVQTGVAVVNAGTYGSEPHMPFGGLKQSGNGWREPGTEALDVYSNLKDIYITIDPGML
ncbi:MAG TPA: aldehyde dehydrogenase family protein [Syntrophobacteria bacterium]|nr:aldehyde dehydrogenase family protein [Syntrophobacteria bacterium]